MIPFLKMNKSLFPYALLFLIVVPIFGFNFLISLIGNVLLLIFLVPILIFLVILISFNALKTNLKTCNKCGTISLGLNENCSNCGADIRDIKNRR